MLKKRFKKGPWVSKIVHQQTEKEKKYHKKCGIYSKQRRIEILIRRLNIDTSMCHNWSQ